MKNISFFLVKAIRELIGAPLDIEQEKDSGRMDTKNGRHLPESVHIFSSLNPTIRSIVHLQGIETSFKKTTEDTALPTTQCICHGAQSGEN